MADFTNWNTAGISAEEALRVAELAERTRDFSPRIGRMTVGLSSGTSGSRGLFLVSPAENARWAGTMLARILRGTLLHRHRAAMFFRANSNLYQSLGTKRFSFNFFDLLKPLGHHAEKIAMLCPTILAAPPAALVQLAAMPEVTKSLAPPRILLSIADVLDENDRAIIERGFQVPCGQLYQATEGFLAGTCPHGTLHWNEDALVIQKQWMDEGRTRYMPIITDFRRTTQPIIRYLLNDVIVEPSGGDCPCGSIFARLGKIEGRQDDVLYFRKESEEKWVAVFPDFIRRAVILGVPAGVDYAVTQSHAVELLVSLSEPCPVEPVAKEIRDLCAQLHAQCPRLKFVPWSPPSLEKKRRRIRRAFPQPDVP